MRHIMLGLFLLLFLQISAPAAGEVRQIELTDGTVITGEVQSLNNGIYTIKSESLGTMKVEDSKVRAIRDKPSSPAGGAASGNANTGGELNNLQKKMANDKEVMGLIQSLQDYPDFKKILEDPEMMKALQEGNIAALTSDPRIMKLLNNPTVKEIEKKVK